MIISQVKFVTPEMAKEWLDNCNTNNRNLNIPRAKEFARMIKDGNWRTTHQGIAFYVDGTLADGQHRLKGIVLANIGINIMVTTGLERLDGLAMDNGLSRSIPIPSHFIVAFLLEQK